MKNLIKMLQKPHSPVKTTQGNFFLNTRVLKQINSNLICDNEKLIKLNERTGNPECAFVVASSRETREKAYRLAYEIYHTSGLVEFEPVQMVVSTWDADPNTFTLLALDSDEKAIGTVSMIFDSKKGLPCEDLYHDEINTLRKTGARVAEVARLAIRNDSYNPLLPFFNLLHIFITRVRHYTDLVMEMNPYHFDFYNKKLLFGKIGGIKNSPRTNDTNAVLAQMNMAEAIQKVKQTGGTKHRGAVSPDPTRFPWFWDYNLEPSIAKHLYRNAKPMSGEEIRYFGLTGSQEKKRQFFFAQ